MVMTWNLFVVDQNATDHFHKVLAHWANSIKTSTGRPSVYSPATLHCTPTALTAAHQVWLALGFWQIIWQSYRGGELSFCGTGLEPVKSENMQQLFVVIPLAIHQGSVASLRLSRHFMHKAPGKPDAT